MDVPLQLPISPMLAKAVDAVPPADTAQGGLVYEPKWDGFRCIVLRDGDEIELASRGKKPLTRYFPEVVAAARAHLPRRCVVDGELVVRSGPPGTQRLDWEALSARIHPAASRIARLSEETPAEMVLFDLLAEGDEDLTGRPFTQRRSRLESIAGGLGGDAPFHLTHTTDDPAVAQDWFTRFEGAGLDGVVAKPADSVYRPGKRTMLKVKHRRTAEAVLTGYRVHKSGRGVGSLLLGMYASDATLLPVGGIVSFTDKRRLELVDELDDLVIRGEDGSPVHAESDRSRFSGSKDVSYVPLRPERVVEVRFDQLEGRRFRHGVGFVRWRPDREPASCLIDQVERAPAYDLDAVLQTG